MKQRCESLLKQWCDALVARQITEIADPGIHGGIMCPEQSRIPGRCADAVYPLMRMARTYGDQRYLDAAVRLQHWSDHVTQPDGSWVNDPAASGWKGITVFGALSLGEALRHHGDLLDGAERERWTDRLTRACDFLMGFMTLDKTNINYPATCAAALAVAAEVLGNDRYAARAAQLADEVLGRFTENMLLFGEGKPHDLVSPGGCLPVDLGYNVEESLPALAVYGTVGGDEEVLQAVTESLRAHLEFMLPDGAWDNSWGTRQFKWTYWGSRTSDGCQPALVLLADRDPYFAEAARRNLDLLAACTHDGLLYGGPHVFQYGQPAFIHHTFCHAKALAMVLDYGVLEGEQLLSASLPREAADGVQEFPEIRTWLVALGPWRAAVTAYDWDYCRAGHPSGGALSLLWNQAIGPVLVSSMTEYSLIEPLNMPQALGSDHECLTPRIECDSFRSITCHGATVSVEEDADTCRFTVRGELVDADGRAPKLAPMPYALRYGFSTGEVVIEAEATCDPGGPGTQFVLPAVATGDDRASVRDNGCVEIARPGGVLQVTTDAPGGFDVDPEARIFNHVPGLEAVRLAVRLAGNARTPVRIRLSVR
ncbi:MAG: hypothetical protein ACYTFZ_01095 [Planctomycetota bacterium]|jgi:hypothetical protein